MPFFNPQTLINARRDFLAGVVVGMVVGGIAGGSRLRRLGAYVRGSVRNIMVYLTPRDESHTGHINCTHDMWPVPPIQRIQPMQSVQPMSSMQTGLNGMNGFDAASAMDTMDTMGAAGTTGTMDTTAATCTNTNNTSTTDDMGNLNDIDADVTAGALDVWRDQIVDGLINGEVDGLHADGANGAMRVRQRVSHLEPARSQSNSHW